MNEIEKLKGEAREVIAGYCAGGDFDAADLVRHNDNEATLGDEIAWTIEKTELRG